MQGAWQRQHELGNRRLELVAVLGDTKVLAPHRTLRRGHLGAAAVLELLARLQQRLMADHAQAAHFLLAVVGVDNHPVARDQLGGDRAGVLDGDGVGEHVMVALGLGLVGQILRLDGDGEFVGGHRNSSGGAGLGSGVSPLCASYNARQNTVSRTAVWPAGVK